MTTTANNRDWCGIVFTDKEWMAWKSGTDSLRNTINNILESGLPLLKAIKENHTLTPAENALMLRIEQIVKAAQEHGAVLAECNEPMLIAFGYKAA